jgi:hypothetical protein
MSKLFFRPLGTAWIKANPVCPKNRALTCKHDWDDNMSTVVMTVEAKADKSATQPKA